MVCLFLLFVDSPGAYPGSELRMQRSGGQSERIDHQFICKLTELIGFLID